MSLQDLQRESETLWGKGFPEKAMTKLEDFGFIQSKAKVWRAFCFSVFFRYLLFCNYYMFYT